MKNYIILKAFACKDDTTLYVTTREGQRIHATTVREEALKHALARMLEGCVTIWSDAESRMPLLPGNLDTYPEDLRFLLEKGLRDFFLDVGAEADLPTRSGQRVFSVDELCKALKMDEAEMRKLMGEDNLATLSASSLAVVH